MPPKRASCQPKKLAHALCALAKKAGDSIVPFYKHHGTVTKKDDDSPLTAADLHANHIILEGLAKIEPHILVISEETPVPQTPVSEAPVSEAPVPQTPVSEAPVSEAPVSEAPVSEAPARPIAPKKDFFLVDPLDGTKEFVAGLKEFTVNIALVTAGGGPCVGVVYAPLLHRLFYGWCVSELRAFEGNRRLSTRAPPVDGLLALASRSHPHPKQEQVFARHRVTKKHRMGSSIKFCLIAAGEADIYIRHGTTKEWDIAAGHAILKGAGGEVVDKNKNPIVYGKKDFVNPAFVAIGRQNSR